MSRDPFAGAKKVSGGSKFVALGEGKDQVASFMGILLAIEESQKYPGSKLYKMGTQEEVVTLAGNRVLDDKVVEIGALYKIEYTGKARGKNYKMFDVWVVDAATVKADGLDKQYKSLAADEPESAGTITVGKPDAEEDDDSDLPF